MEHETKTQKVKRLLLAGPERKLADIAREAGCARGYVGMVRAKLGMPSKTEEFRQRVGEGQRWCYFCKKALPADQVGLTTGSHRAGICRTCRAEDMRERRARKRLEASSTK